jgi:hypothetical protein
MTRLILMVAVVALTALGACAATLLAYFLRATRGATGLRSRVLAFFAQPRPPAARAPASHYYKSYWARS